MQYLTQEDLEQMTIGSRLWIAVLESVQFSATLTGIQHCGETNLGLVLVDLDENEMVALFRKEAGKVSKYGTTIALTESHSAGMWEFTLCESAEQPGSLLFNSRADLRIISRKGENANVSVNIRRLKRQLQCAKQNIVKKEANLLKST